MQANAQCFVDSINCTCDSAHYIFSLRIKEELYVVAYSNSAYHLSEFMAS